MLRLSYEATQPRCVPRLSSLRVPDGFFVCLRPLNTIKILAIIHECRASFDSSLSFQVQSIISTFCIVNRFTITALVLGLPTTYRCLKNILKVKHPRLHL